MNRILVIRGGAIGDFLLTLPALKALRESRPQAHIEILGYTHVIVLGDNRFYAQAVRSIESAQLSRFFATNSELPSEFADYFRSFDLIISYLYDPDSIFETNLRRCGVEHVLCGPARIVQTAGHAARQLAGPVEQLGIEVFDLSERVFLSAEDRQFATEFLWPLQQPVLTIHPGSGSKEKNWPLEHWIKLVERAHGSTENFRSLNVVCGEADEAQRQQLERQWNSPNLRFANNLPLPQLAALLEKSVFIGHDSGISHLAAAAGADCILLFGPTDPDVWAPRNSNVRIIRAPNKAMRDLDVEAVEGALVAASSGR
jgi:heptosyltransferase-2